MIEDIMLFIAKVIGNFISVIIIIGIVLLMAACLFAGMTYFVTGDVIKSLGCFVICILIGCTIVAVID